MNIPSDFWLHFFGGALSTFVAGWICIRLKIKSFQDLGQHILREAEKEGEEKKSRLLEECKKNRLEEEQSLLLQQNRFEKKREQEEARLKIQFERLEHQLELLDQKLNKIRQEEENFELKQKELEKQQQTLNALQGQCLQKLEQQANLTREEAKELLFNEIESSCKQEVAKRCTLLYEEGQQKAEHAAQKTLALALQRQALSSLSPFTGCAVFLPHEEMKRKLIGREGRNIRALEMLTGVQLLFDEMPGHVWISSLDPERKHLAKIVVEQLLEESRIHPSRIEEVVLKCRADFLPSLKRLAQEVALKAGVPSLHPELLTLLGQLHLRYQAGQNLLQHSLEVSLLAGSLAAETKGDVDLAKRIGLLHDIGKASKGNEELSHALLGSQIAERYGENEKVTNGIAAHHEEVRPLTLEAAFVYTANLLSAERPGARKEMADHYFKRMVKLESLCQNQEGVLQAFAIQGGKEVRVIVEAEVHDESATHYLANQIAKKIEQELSFSGQVKVVVVRETKTIAYAT